MPTRRKRLVRRKKKATVNQRQTKGGTQVSVIVDQRKTARPRKTVLIEPRRADPVPPAVTNLDRGTLDATRREVEAQSRAVRQAIANQNSLIDDALTKNFQLLQNEIASKKFTVEGQPSLYPPVDLLTPRSQQDESVKRMKDYLKSVVYLIPRQWAKKQVRESGEKYEERVGKYIENKLKQVDAVRGLYSEVKSLEQLATSGGLLTPAGKPKEDPSTVEKLQRMLSDAEKEFEDLQQGGGKANLFGEGGDY